jgi:hypothetical protein
MKTYCAFLIFVATLLVACNRQATQPTGSDVSKDREQLNISDFVPCTDCEFEGELVNPLPEEWSETEKELYRVTIDFWEETTGFLFTSEMIDLYKQSGPAACRDRFVKVISGELKGDGSTVESEDPIRTFGWRERFEESAIEQMKVSDPCKVGIPEPNPGTESYATWEGDVYRCIDIVFHAGVPACFYVERPIIHDSQSAIVRLRLYDAVDSKGVPHLESGHYLYFSKVNNVWLFSMRRDK